MTVEKWSDVVTRLTSRSWWYMIRLTSLGRVDASLFLMLGWNLVEPTVTDDDGGEIGSGHVADAVGEGLVYVFIGKPLGEQHRSKPSGVGIQMERGRMQVFRMVLGMWHAMSSDVDGSVVAGFDIGTGVLLRHYILLRVKMEGLVLFKILQ